MGVVAVLSALAVPSLPPALAYAAVTGAMSGTDSSTAPGGLDALPGAVLVLGAAGGVAAGSRLAGGRGAVAGLLAGALVGFGLGAMLHARVVRRGDGGRVGDGAARQRAAGERERSRP
ncbi:MAG: hypothetical protein ACTHOD_11375 [Motilibacteraceae bacterium]